MEEQNIDKAIRDKLNSFSQQPPSHVWDNIQGQLLTQKRKRKFVLLGRIAAAALIILAFLAGWYFNEKSNRIIPAISENRIQNSQNSNELIIPDGKDESFIPDRENRDLIVERQNDNQNNGSNLDGSRFGTDLTETTTDFVTGSQKYEDSFSAEGNELEIRENSKLDLMDRIEVLFRIKENGNFGREQEIIAVNEISKADEILIAENIRNLDDQENEDMKWKIGVQVSPGYSSQNSSYSEAYSNAMTYSGQNGNSNLSGGISVQVKTGKKWSIESGLYYSQNGQRSTNSGGFNFRSTDYTLVNGGFFNTEVNLANGQIAMNSTAGVIEFSKTPPGTELSSGLDELASATAPALITEGEFSQVFEFVEVPLYLRYSLIDANFGVEILGGLNAGIVAGNKVFMENQYGNQNIGKTRDISTVNLSGTLGVGVNYGLGKNISVAVEPRFSYFLNSINQNPEVSFRPYRIGIFTGLYYEF